jgi:DUF2911 family protein
MKKQFALLSTLVLSLTLFAFAQEKTPASPPAHAQCQFPDRKTVKIDYSSPRMKGRTIYGGLVPYGQVWRTGANAATTFVTDANLSVGGKDIPAGSYTLFTIPEQNKWTLIINKKTAEWGIPYKYQSDELARVEMSVSKTPSQVENFTIDFDQTGGGCTLRLDWENTRASVQIEEKK